MTGAEGTGAPIVEAPDELDAATARELVDAAAAALQDSGQADVVIDLAYTTFMDSTGLGALVDVSRLTRERGGAVHLREPDRRLMEIIRVAGLESAFVIDRATED